MSTIVEAESATEAVIVISRMFDAPRDLVWTAMTEPRHVSQWWGGPGFTNPVCEMDLRPGGLWRHVMRSPDGSEFAFDFVFLEVVKPERLVWQNVDHGKRAPGGPPTCVNTVTFEDHGGRTRWKLVARFNSFAERDLSVQMGFSHMINASNERLVAYLQTM
jgi:uncharacterized protein YndB with AHSA1/START domain